MKILLVVALVLLLGCTTAEPVSGRVVDKEFEPAYSYVTVSVCIDFEGDLNPCTKTNYVSDRWYFSIESGTEIVRIRVTEEEFDKYEIGVYCGR